MLQLPHSEAVRTMALRTAITALLRRRRSAAVDAAAARAARRPTAPTTAPTAAPTATPTTKDVAIGGQTGSTVA